MSALSVETFDQYQPPANWRPLTERTRNLIQAAWRAASRNTASERHVYGFPPVGNPSTDRIIVGNMLSVELYHYMPYSANARADMADVVAALIERGTELPEAMWRVCWFYLP